MANEILWLVLVVIFCIVEASTAGLVSIWFAGGALIALISAIAGVNIYVQTLLFLLSSALLLFLLRKIAINSFKFKNEKTNTDRLIGQEVVITETVDNRGQIGKAKINDVEWKVKSESGDVIQKGETATVCKIEGVKLIVSK